MCNACSSLNIPSRLWLCDAPMSTSAFVSDKTMQMEVRSSGSCKPDFTVKIPFTQLLFAVKPLACEREL